MLTQTHVVSGKGQAHSAAYSEIVHVLRAAAGQDVVVHMQEHKLGRVRDSAGEWGRRSQRMA